MSVENNIEQKLTKNENVLASKKNSSLTIRLDLTLREPDEESCSIFNYNSLITEEKRRRRREREENQLNGSVEELEEGDSEVKRLAEHFEEKYGGVNVKKRKKKRAPKFYNYTDLAAGYDESDSFIDNSEAFDEALPDDMETAFGGYYVNTGQLELKKVEITDETSDPDEIRAGKRKSCVLRSDDDSSSDGEGAPSDDNNVKSDDEDVESVNKKLPDEIHHEQAEPAEPSENRFESWKSPIDLEDKINNVIKVNGDLIVKKKKKYKKQRTENENPDEMPKQKKKAATVKSMLEEKRIVENSRSSCETEKGSHTDETGTVESVGVISTNAKPSGGEPVRMPDNLDPELLELITQIRKCVSESEASGARSLFKLSVNSKSSVNAKLLQFESQVRSMKSAAKHALYEYLAHFLPCSKDTLMKRAKRLLVEEEERHIVEPLQKLKASVDKAMPAIMDSYSAAVQRVADDKGMNDLKNGEVDEKKSIASKMPPKKFAWNDETRRHLRDLVACRLKSYRTLKLRKESSEDYVKKFLETKVMDLWPPGWMELSILVKEAQFSNSQPKVKKIVNGSAPEVDSVPTSMSTASTTVTSVKKKSVSPVPSSVNSVHSASVGAGVVNYNFLANPLTLPSLAVPHPMQTDASYSSTSSYRPDLSILRTQLPVDMIAQLAQLTQRPSSTTSTQAAYSKSISPPKKSTTPTPPYPTSRSATPVSSAPPASSAYLDKKKSADASSSKQNESFKIDSLINTNAKTKKEHHMLNHISQYNKHYSHKTDKRRNNQKKDVHVPNKSKTNHNNGTNGCNVDSRTPSPSVAKANNSGLTVDLNRKNRSKSVVLDLSPNKVIKDGKCDKSDRRENSPAPSCSVTAKDHNYWAAASVREETKEEITPDFQSQPRMSFSPPESNSSLSSSKTPHISRKQRILQESAKSMAQTAPDSFSTGHIAPSESTSRRSESHSISNLVSAKIEEKLSSFDDKRNREETTTATDLLSKIINDSLQNPLSYELAKKDTEFKSEERILSPADLTLRPSSRDSLSSVGSLNAERKTPNSVETAEIIQDLLALNQIGGHSIPRRMDYHDSKKHNEFSNGSMMSQSSLHLSEKNRTAPLPRMNISPFQNEFFKHVSQSRNESSSSYNTNSKSQDNCFTSELPSLEVDRSLLNRTTNASKQENSTVFNYQQSVIMPPATSRWYLPESKS